VINPTLQRGRNREVVNGRPGDDEVAAFELPDQYCGNSRRPLLRYVRQGMLRQGIVCIDIVKRFVSQDPGYNLGPRLLREERIDDLLREPGTLRGSPARAANEMENFLQGLTFQIKPAVIEAPASPWRFYALMTFIQGP
jgi:hypothetical protein